MLSIQCSCPAKSVHREQKRSSSDLVSVRRFPSRKIHPFCSIMFFCFYTGDVWRIHGFYCHDVGIGVWRWVCFVSVLHVSRSESLGTPNLTKKKVHPQFLSAGSILRRRSGPLWVHHALVEHVEDIFAHPTPPESDCSGSISRGGKVGWRGISQDTSLPK